MAVGNQPSVVSKERLKHYVLCAANEVPNLAFASKTVRVCLVISYRDVSRAENPFHSWYS